MSLFAAPSTGLVLDAVTNRTASSVSPTHLAHTAHTSPKPSPETVSDNPLRDALVKLAKNRVLPNRVLDSSESKSPRSRPTSLTPLFSVKGGKLQHGYPRSLAPYPSNYDRAVIDCDVLDQAFLAGLYAGSPSMLPHVDLSDPTTHPRKTLDLGCGSGAWVISAASLWPQTRFVGFDLVPQATNLSVFQETPAPNSAVPLSKRFGLTQRRTAKTTPTNGSHSGSTLSHRRLAERVRFVHGNFLINGLPFEDGEFDHVRISGVARGVPENKWDCLLAEVHRVLCDGGHLEMIEEDIIFPILPRRVDAPAQRKSPDDELEGDLFYRRPTHVLRPSTSSSTGSSCSSSASHIARKEDDISHSRTGSTRSRSTYVPSQPSSVSLSAQNTPAGTYGNSGMIGSSQSSPATRKPSQMADKPLPPPPTFKGTAFNNLGSNPGASTRSSLVRTGQPSSQPGGLPHVSGTPSLRSVASIRSAPGKMSPKPGNNVHSMAFAIIGRTPSSPMGVRQVKKERIVTAAPSKQPRSFKAPDSQSVEAVTRHGHAILEVLFNSVFEGRFINTSPTAILPSYLNTYFRNLIASPRVEMPTPPAPEGRVKDTFGTGNVDMVPLKPALKNPLQPAAAMAHRHPAPQTHERPRYLSRSASIPLLPTGQIPRPRTDLSVSSESEESDFASWSARSLTTPTTPPEQLKGNVLLKAEEHPGEDNKKEFPSSSLLTMFDEEDDAREAITSPRCNWARLSPATDIPQEEAPITLDAALAAIEGLDYCHSEPLSAFRRRSVDVGIFKRGHQRKLTRKAEKNACQSFTQVKARDSAGSGLCLELPKALFKLDERDMALHLRKTYMGVIACREAMWEELQRRAKTVTDEHGVACRTTLLDHVQWSPNERLMSDSEKFDLLFRRFENDMRVWYSVGSLISEQWWIRNDSPFAAPQQKGLECKVPSELESDEPLVGRDISRILRVFVAHKLEDGPPLGRRGTRS